MLFAETFSVITVSVIIVNDYNLNNDGVEIKENDIKHHYRSYHQYYDYL